MELASQKIWSGYSQRDYRERRDDFVPHVFVGFRLSIIGKTGSVS